MPKIEYVEYPNVNSFTRGVMSSVEQNLELFNKAFEERKSKYSDYKPSEQGQSIAKEIEEKGHAKIEQFISHDLLDSLNERVTEILEDKNSPYNQSHIQESTGSKSSMYLQCKGPLMVSPMVRELAFNDLIADIAGAYIGCKPAIGTCNLRRSYVNDLREGGTQIYHVDPNSPKFLKFFVYLDDVDEDGGPFCYVEGSHRKKFLYDGQHFNIQYSWPKQAIEQIYGQDKVKLLTAKKGDLLVADTNGWHRGTKPKNKNRTMLTLDYVCHYEEHRKSSAFELPKNAFEELNQSQKDMCDFLKLV